MLILKQSRRTGQAWLALAVAWLVVALLSGCDSGNGNGNGGQSSGATATAPQSSASASGAQKPGVQPLETILSKGPVFSDPRPNSVTVLIDTTIPVVCAAAYGTTDAYGRLATDTDMAGGAHQNHHPLLGGLQSDTEYHIRLQGVGPDGTLYQSKDYTFHTPKATPSGKAPQGQNLALLSSGARVVGVSSNYGGGDNNSSFGANHAIDGDPNTQWSSNGDGNKAWIEIQLPRKGHITTIGFWSRTMGSSAEIRAFRVIADGATSYGPFKLADASTVYYFPVDFTAHRLRFEAVDTSGGNTGAVEIEVFGSP